MKFIDEAFITVQSGHGGRGCVSFRREKFIERGGPDGGDGGDGGSVILKASRSKRTLYRFRHQKLIKAQIGGYGQGSNKYGKKGDDVIIELPLGTIVSDADTNEILKDFTNIDETFVVAKGGRGGKGNKHFATSRNKAPRFAQPGEPGQTINLKLELKLLADVGLIGFPNAGKSTLISVLSAARPKIADYPFTTLTPNLGVVDTKWGEPFTVADIPGLIEGAHTGVGLGIKFLRHIERTRILVHIIDISAVDLKDPLYRYRSINKELSMYSQKLAIKPQVVVLNKIDISNTQEIADSFCKAFAKEYKSANHDIMLISAATVQGIEDLKSRIVTEISKLDE